MKKYKPIFKEEKLEEGLFSLKDDILEGITFEDLIVTLQSNEPSIDEKVVSKVFEELLKMKIEDARYELKKNLKNIVKEAS